MKIREATPSDVEGMKGVLRDAFHNTYTGAGEFYSSSQFVDPNYPLNAGPYYNVQIFLEESLANIEKRLTWPFRAFVAVGDKKIIGYIITEIHKGRLWVSDMAVKPNYQKRGVGKNLFKVATQHNNQVYIWVNSKNPALEFWKKLGFAEILEEKLMVKNRV